MTDKQSRRRFLQLAALGASSSVAYDALGATDKPGAAKFQLGMASYTLRAFPTDRAIAMTNRLALKFITFKSMHLPLESTAEQIAAAAARVKAAGLELYGGGVIYMNNAAEVDRAFEYAKAAGMKIIIGVPQHDLLPMVEKKVKEYDIKVAIHNHGPEDKVYPTPQSVYEKVKDLDSRIGLCLDIGHSQRSGIDPAEAADKFADRLFDVHIKDVDAATAKGNTIEMGRGVIDIPKFIRTLIKVNYAGITAFEFEKDEKDPLPGVAESVGYTRGILAAL